MKDFIRKEICASGAVAVGFAKADVINAADSRFLCDWIKEGCHADMSYLERHALLRENPANVLPDVKTVISVAFSYAPSVWRSLSLPALSAYAYGKDYHEVLRKRLLHSIPLFKEKFGGNWRICIDSAPLAERYWAMKTGIGHRLKSGNIFIDNAGSLCFLAEILTSIEIEPDENISDTSLSACADCNVCVNNCPGGALRGDGSLDARKCVSYLTIEKKDDFTEKETSLKNRKVYNNGFLYGCDLCLRLCKLNRNITPTAIEEFKPIPYIMHLDRKDIENMDSKNFSSIFAKSPIKRIKLDRLKRNVRSFCL